MTRSDYAKVLLAVRRQNPVTPEGVARLFSIGEDKHTVARKIARHKKVRAEARRRGFA